MDLRHLYHLRKEYRDQPLNQKDLSKDPFEQFLKWLREAIESNILEPNAMILATASKEGVPSSRCVLLKQCDSKGFVFFTNYQSLKAKNLEENPIASATFYWRELERQLLIFGMVEKIAQEESAAYFLTRPHGAQIAAWTSQQGMPVRSREALEKAYTEMEHRFEDRNIPLPPYWGGYRIIPKYYEFWQGRSNRLHDRFGYAFEEGKWSLKRLFP